MITPNREELILFFDVVPTHITHNPLVDYEYWEIFEIEKNGISLIFSIDAANDRVQTKLSSNGNLIQENEFENVISIDIFKWENTQKLEVRCVTPKYDHEQTKPKYELTIDLLVHPNIELTCRGKRTH